MATQDFQPGLKGVIAAQTKLSHSDGQRGRLIIAGYELEEIAPRASFEEMAYLLLKGALPNQEELAAFSEALVLRRRLPEATLRLLEQAASRQLGAIDALGLGVASLRLAATKGSAEEDALLILAALPVLAATYGRLSQGQTLVEPRTDLGHGANYLYMLSGAAPDPASSRALETYWNTVVDHGLNASTFTARVIISTGSDLLAAVVGALGALKGPLHGGAPGPALDMVFEIARAERIEPVLRQKLAQGERLMGFGHRVYKVRDPRAEVLAGEAERLFRQSGDLPLYELAKAVEAKAVELLDEYKPGRQLRTNVEFYTALLLHGLGLPTVWFTPTFAVGRAAGWIAHCAEQTAAGQIIRPGADYIGPEGRRWVGLEERD